MWSVHHVEDYVGDGSEEGKDEENQNGPEATLTAKVVLGVVVVAAVVGRRAVGRLGGGIIKIGLGGSTVGGCSRGSGTIHGDSGGVGRFGGGENSVRHCNRKTKKKRRRKGSDLQGSGCWKSEI
ncbi:hypothetical protein SLEP1_g55475 [Rubroshorea leprosula]|uniref:Uncharacterized protein n=1 Tax=Rubroshorea leprosula TaxID=152421 RepID=A0AAV5MGM1_9ROSI|nr:hypothetical protein SLEP1_g55475 [Rubroshorea leprosula]